MEEDRVGKTLSFSLVSFRTVKKKKKITPVPSLLLHLLMLCSEACSHGVKLVQVNIYFLKALVLVFLVTNSVSSHIVLPSEVLCKQLASDVSV